MPKVNPEILVWARQAAGITLEEAAKKLGFRDSKKTTAVDKLTALEDGTKEPTRPVLAKMAQQYRRPLVAFYLSKPPAKGDRGADFRTLPAEHSTADEARLDALLRDIRARQSIVCDMLADEDETEPLAFIGSHTTADGQPTVLASLRALLAVDVEEYRAQHNTRLAFNLLRERAEKAGIFILLMSNLGSHHTDFDTDIFRGFAIADAIAPFVVINRNDAPPAWSFTLLHELVHLLLGQTGVSAAPGENAVEQFCNDVAGEFLLPAAEAQQLVLADEFNYAVEQISTFAEGRNLSRAMVAYKAYRSGSVDQQMLNHLMATFRTQWLQNRTTNRRKQEKQQGGPNYYVLRRHEVGKPLVEFAQQRMRAGEMTTSKAANVLGVKPGQVHLLFDAGKPS